MHKIAEEIRNCKNACFVDRYQDFKYNNNKLWQKNEIDCIKPLVYSPEKPKILLISQAPSKQAWLNGINNNSLDGGLVSSGNKFLINNLLLRFDLGLKTFEENVFWIHTCNCYPWFKIMKKSGEKNDLKPSYDEVEGCLGKWRETLLKIDSLNAIILMGAPATQFFTEFKDEGFTDLAKKMNVRNDIIKGIDILPINHPSGLNRNNTPEYRDNLKRLLKDCFIKWIK